MFKEEVVINRLVLCGGYLVICDLVYDNQLSGHHVHVCVLLFTYTYTTSTNTSALIIDL